MTQATVGFQPDGSGFSQVIFFEDNRDLNEFTDGNFEFSAQATAVAITAGVSAEASTGGGVSAGASGGRNDATTTHGGYRKGMAIFTIAKGGLNSLPRMHFPGGLLIGCDAGTRRASRERSPTRPAK